MSPSPSVPLGAGTVHAAVQIPLRPTASGTTGIRLGYEFDKRDSPDEDRTYRGHWLGITFRQRLQTFGGRR